VTNRITWCEAKLLCIDTTADNSDIGFKRDWCREFAAGIQGSLDIDVLIRNLTNRGFELTREVSFSELLGTKFESDDANDTVTAAQPGLIQKIIKATGVEDCSCSSHCMSPLFFLSIQVIAEVKGSTTSRPNLPFASPSASRCWDLRRRCFSCPQEQACCRPRVRK